jgi:exodeoxyribonuclease-5
MLANHLASLIKNNLWHPPTTSQEDLISLLAAFVFDSGPNSIFIVKGYAGTGKTSLISALVKALDSMQLNTLLLAPTGRAAKVFSAYAGKPAFTIHRKIYIQRSSKDGFGHFVLNKNLNKNTLFIVDEASMISDAVAEDSIFGSGRLLQDLLYFMAGGINCRLILVGDTAQLPPVGVAISPALERHQLSAYYPVSGEAVLTEIVRQSVDSGILLNATRVRNQIDREDFSVPILLNAGLPDTWFISGAEIADRLESAYSRFGLEETMILCRSNKRANQYNSGIRKQILFREEELTAGDLLMVVKNNYHWAADKEEIDFIANGDIVKVQKIHKYINRYDFRFAWVTLYMVDYDLSFEAWILLDTLMAETPAMNMDDNKRMYYNILEDFKHIEPRSRQFRMVKEDPFFNALQVKFSYAVTCHKAQGGQWKAIFIDQGYQNPDRINLEYLRWLYTAITRATQELYLVNFPDQFKATV